MRRQGQVLVGVGGTLAAIGFVWAYIIGFYPNELPVIIVFFAVGFLLLFIGSKKLQATKPSRVAWTPTSTPPTTTATAASTPAVVAPAPIQNASAEPGSDVVETSDASADLRDATIAVPRRKRRITWSALVDEVEVPLSGGMTVVGRAPTASGEFADARELVVADPSVSKTHAVLQIDGGVLRVRDLGSANGTFVVVNDIETPCEHGVWNEVPDGSSVEFGTAAVVFTSAHTREATQ